MHCPQCGIETHLLNGRCARCGLEVQGRSGRLPTDPALFAKSANAYTLSHGDHLNDGRYRLMGQIVLPETQRRQGRAWVATDTKSAHRRVMVREMLAPRELLKNSSADQVCYAVAQRFQALSQRAGLIGVRDFFTEQGCYFLVFASPEGVNLASLLKRHGGALPEYQVASYGYQICDLLALLADQQPPLVHGSINPETIFIDEEQQVASLIHLPLFKPDPPPSNSGQVSAGYYAPEQVHGDCNPTTDLYGLAVTMHHMVTGYDPRTRLALFHPPARRLNPAVTTQMEMILARQLSLSTSQRYIHPTEMQKDLSALLAAYPETPANKTPEQEANPLQLSSVELHERSKNMLMLNMGVFAAICILLLVGIFLVVLR